jgi:hypothetical protein
MFASLSGPEEAGEETPPDEGEAREDGDVCRGSRRRPQTNLTTTKKRYTHGRHRIQLALFHHLAAFSGNLPSALLNLCYRHIVVTLLRDPNGGPHRILIEFTCEFTKQYLGMKDA